MLRKSSKETEQLVTERPQKRECLLVMLQHQLILSKVRPWPISGFLCDGRRYDDAGFGEWTQFYDWLRDSKGNVLGVRYWLDSDTEFLADYAKELSYVQLDRSRYLEIFFSKQRGFNQSRSADQDFLYDAIFRTSEGQYAIGFGMGGLNETDLLSLQKAPELTWAQAHLTRTEAKED